MQEEYKEQKERRKEGSRDAQGEETLARTGPQSHNMAQDPVCPCVHMPVCACVHTMPAT